jgi:CubicO group peptidase (beta-lactamase class C family)
MLGHGTGLDARRLEAIDDHFERNYIAPGKIAGCQIAINRRGRHAYFKSFGMADRERGKSVADDTIFRIYSMTKPITSVALMQLWERGYFPADRPGQPLRARVEAAPGLGRGRRGAT